MVHLAIPSLFWLSLLPPLDIHGDPLPDGAVARIGSMRYRAGEIWRSALSPDGKRLLHDSGSGELMMTDLATGQRPLAIAEPALTANRSGDSNRLAVTFSDDGLLFAAIAEGGTVRLWDVQTGEVVREYALGFANDVRGVQFLPGDRELLVLAESQVWFVERTSGEVLRHFATPGPVTDVSPDGDLLAACDGPAYAVRLLRSADGIEVRELSINGRAAEAVFSPDGHHLAALAPSIEVRAWEVASGREVLRREVAPVSALAFSPKGDVLFAGRREGSVLRWTFPQGEERPRMQFRKEITGLHVTPDGSELIVASRDGLINRWDLKANQAIRLPDGFTSDPWAVPAKDGSFVVVGEQAGKIDRWHPFTGERQHVIRDQDEQLSRIAVSPDGQTIAASRFDGGIELWDQQSQHHEGILSHSSIRVPYGVACASLHWSPHGRYLLSSDSRDGTILWDVRARWELWSRPGLGPTVFTGDGRWVLIGSKGRVHFCQPNTGKLRPGIRLSEDLLASDGLWTVACSRNGDRVATFDHHAIRLFDIPSGQELRRWGPAEGTILTLALSPDGAWLFSAGTDRTVDVWEVATGQRVLSLSGHLGTIRHLALLSDGRHLCSSSADLTVLVWSLRPTDTPDLLANPEAVLAKLSSQDAAEAYRAMWSLVAQPDSAPVVLREHYPWPEFLDDDELRRLVRNLNAEEFAIREAASAHLQEFGWPHRKQLIAELDRPASAEVGRRIQTILARWDEALPPAELSLRRTMQALEWIGTTDARELADEWRGIR